MEIWKIIPKYEFYEVSNLGRVKSLRKNIIMKQNIGNMGYYTVCLYGSDKSDKLTACVHKLVLLAFVPNPQNKPQGNHINGIKTDNRLDNLEWVTRSENNIHAYAIGLSRSRKGMGNSQAILTNDQVLEIFNSKMKTSELSAQFKIKRRVVNSIKSGKTWGHITKKSYVKKERSSRLSNELVLTIYNDNRTTFELSKVYPVPSYVICSIKNGHSYCNITGYTNPLKKNWVLE